MSDTAVFWGDRYYRSLFGTILNRRQSPASYVVWNDGTKIYADSMTGGTDYNDVLANADLIIKNAIAAAMPINAASEPLGTLFFKRSAVNYVLNSPLIVKPSFTGNPAMPSMIGEGVGAGIEISTDPNGPVTFQPSNSFPSGEYLLAYLPNTLSYSIKGAKIAGLAFFGQSPDGTNRGAGANFVNTRQFRITDLSTNFTVAPAPVLTTLGESASAALNISQSGSPGGFDYIDGCTSTKAGQDGIYFQSAESTMVACRVLAHTRIGYNINSFDMALFGCMIDSGGGSAGNPQIYIAQGGNDDTRIVGFNSFAGPLLGGPTVFVSSQAGDAQHPVFTASRFNGPQQAGLGDNGAIILLTGACDIDFIGCDFSALSAAQTTYFIRGRSDFTGKCRIIGGRFNRKNNAVTAVISTVGASGIIVCRDVGNFNPLGLLSTPYDNTNNWIGYLGGSSTLTSAKTYTCNVTSLDLYLAGGTVSAMTKNAQVIPYNSTLTSIHLEPGDTWSITFTITPTTNLVFGY